MDQADENRFTYVEFKALDSLDLLYRLLRSFLSDRDRTAQFVSQNQRRIFLSKSLNFRTKLRKSVKFVFLPFDSCFVCIIFSCPLLSKVSCLPLSENSLDLPGRLPACLLARPLTRLPVTEFKKSSRMSCSHFTPFRIASQPLSRATSASEGVSERASKRATQRGASDRLADT